MAEKAISENITWTNKIRPTENKKKESGKFSEWAKRAREKYAGYRALGWVILIGLILLWQYASTRRLINPTIASSPSRIWEKFVSMIRDGSLARHVLTSLGRVFKGFLIGGLLGLILGFLCGLYPKFEAVADLFIGLLRPIPPIAWIPVLILALGIGESSKVTVIAIGSFWPMLLNSMEGVKGADKSLLELGDVLEKDKKTQIFKIILPSAIPSIFTGARLAISRAWSCVVTAEMIAASAGVGYLIQYARELSQPALMFTGVAVIGLIGLLIDAIMKLLEKKLLYWAN